MHRMLDRNDLQLADYRALAELRYQIRRFLRFSEEVAREAGLEPQHHQLMLAIKGAPPGVQPKIAYLAERLQIQHNSAVELLDRLARHRLIQRSRSAQDRREVHVTLTSRGERLLAQLTLHTRAELRSSAPALVETLRKVVGSNRARPRVAARSTAGRKRS